MYPSQKIIRGEFLVIKNMDDEEEVENRILAFKMGIWPSKTCQAIMPHTPSDHSR